MPAPRMRPRSWSARNTTRPPQSCGSHCAKKHADKAKEEKSKDDKGKEDKAKEEKAKEDKAKEEKVIISPPTAPTAAPITDDQR